MIDGRDRFLRFREETGIEIKQACKLLHISEGLEKKSSGDLLTKDFKINQALLGIQLPPIVLGRHYDDAELSLELGEFRAEYVSKSRPKEAARESSIGLQNRELTLLD